MTTRLGTQPEGRSHGVPESQSQRDAGVGFLSTRERLHATGRVQGGSLSAGVGVDLDGESGVLVVQQKLADVIPGF